MEMSVTRSFLFQPFFQNNKKQKQQQKKTNRRAESADRINLQPFCRHSSLPQRVTPNPKIQ